MTYLVLLMNIILDHTNIVINKVCVYISFK